MNRNYIFLTVLMLILAFGTFFLTKPKELKQIEPQELLREIVQPTRYITTDQVAKMIIKKDPSLELIDLRNTEEFDLFALPNSINIPLDSILNKNSLMYFGIPGTKVVFICNDDIQSDQAWVITKRLGYKSTYVMTGGLNRWMETIIQPTEPLEDAPASSFDMYALRKGAQLYFTGANAEPVETSKVKVDVVRKKKATTAAGGC